MRSGLGSRTRIALGLVFSVATILLALAWPTGRALAASGPWASGQSVRARLVSATDGVGQGREVHAGLQIALEKGWDTYWRSPGDAGAAPRADWSASRNVASVDWRWPAPTRFTLFGLETFGYRGEVLFPLTVHVKRPGEPVALNGNVDLLVCSRICLPRTLALSLVLPAAPASVDPEAANLIARGEARVPDDGTQSGLTVGEVAAQAGKPAALTVRIASRQPLAVPDVIVESPTWSFGAPTVAFAPDRKSATATLPVTSGPDVVAMPGSAVTVTVEDGARAAEARAKIARGAIASRSWLGDILPFLGLALLGGLILNLMPCVLPVLSLKLFAVLRHHGQERRLIRVGFLATAIGMIVSMLAIGGLLAGLKLAGVAVGWGIQFQHPLFLAFLAGVLIVFAANLAGFFQVGLPRRLANVLATAGGDSMAGSFLSGAFATLLATPCSAPFVGTALAFALARGPAEILAIFGALGSGFAAPNLLVAVFPGLTRALPKPGRWINVVRRVLALALAGSAAWLLTVLAAQTSAAAAVGVGIAFIVLAAALAARPRIGAPATAALSAFALVAAAMVPSLLTATPTRAATTSWVRFDGGAVRRLVAEGQVVFVDVTADWCVTCHANRVWVIDSPEVARALAQPHTVAMMADWTRPNPRISDYLARNSRYGIPFNAVYGPGAPRGIVLSELLTKDAVLHALRQARSGGRLTSR